MSGRFELRRQDMIPETLGTSSENGVVVTEVQWTEPEVLQSDDNYAVLKKRKAEELAKIKVEDLYKTIIWITPAPPEKK